MLVVNTFKQWLTCGYHVENEIIGEALIHLAQDDLAELGVTSIGHQLSILKAVYNIKIAQDVPIEPEHYVPICKSLIFLLIFNNTDIVCSSCWYVQR